MDTEIVSQQCKRCKQTKPLAEFVERKANKLGRAKTCVACVVEIQRSNPVKTCRECGTEKNLEEFAKANGNRDGRINTCKECNKEYLKLWYAVNREEWKEHVKDRTGRLCKVEGFRRKYIDNVRKCRLKREYGLTPEDYERMLEDQNGVCAICLKTDVVTGRRLAVDHCHKTGVVRGLLCSQCNTAIGRFEDDTEVIERAIAYLNKHNFSRNGFSE